jgi:hypothetical protein
MYRNAANGSKTATITEMTARGAPTEFRRGSTFMAARQTNTIAQDHLLRTDHPASCALTFSGYA